MVVWLSHLKVSRWSRSIPCGMARLLRNRGLGRQVGARHQFEAGGGLWNGVSRLIVLLLLSTWLQILLSFGRDLFLFTMWVVRMALNLLFVIRDLNQ